MIRPNVCSKTANKKALYPERGYGVDHQSEPGPDMKRVLCIYIGEEQVKSRIKTMLCGVRSGD